MRVAVYGAGAVGAFYGARMSLGGADVELIARGAHLAAIRDHGLTVVTPDETTHHDLSVTDDPATVGPVDVVLFCVKSYDTDVVAAAARTARPGWHGGRVAPERRRQRGEDRGRDRLGACSRRVGLHPRRRS